MKKTLLIITMLVMSSLSMSAMRDNENRLEDFTQEAVIENEEMKMISRERSSELEDVDVREFFEEKLNNYKD